MPGIASLSVMSTVALSVFGGGGWVFVLFLLLSLLAFLAYASFSISSGIYLRAFCRKQTREKLVALTFDDGPHPAYTPQVLNVLKQYNVKATFFVMGERVAGNEDIVRRADEEGHQVGNHSYTHKKTFPFFGSKKMCVDINMCGSAIARTGITAGWFRPPFGITNPDVAKAVKMLGYHVAGWSIRSLDTVISDKEKVVKRVVSRLHPGAIILLHDHLPDAPFILEHVIQQTQRKGYRFATVDELFALDVS